MSGGIPGYLDYPWRRRGLDHDRFPHRNLADTPKVTWPGGARVALWITVHAGHFPMDMPEQPFVATGGMERPYPSYWDYTQRDYGNRVGVFRLLRVLHERRLPATALLSGTLAIRYPALLRHVMDAGWEIAAAGLDMGRLHHGGLDKATERTLVAEAKAAIEGATGTAPRIWHSPAHSE